MQFTYSRGLVALWLQEGVEVSAPALPDGSRLVLIGYGEFVRSGLPKYDFLV